MEKRFLAYFCKTVLLFNRENHIVQIAFKYALCKFISCYFSMLSLSLKMSFTRFNIINVKFPVSFH